MQHCKKMTAKWRMKRNMTLSALTCPIMHQHGYWNYIGSLVTHNLSPCKTVNKMDSIFMTFIISHWCKPRVIQVLCYMKNILCSLWWGNTHKSKILKGYWGQHKVVLWSQRTAPPVGGLVSVHRRSVWGNGNRTPSRTTCMPPELIYAGSNSSQSASPTDTHTHRNISNLLLVILILDGIRLIDALNALFGVKLDRLTCAWISEILLQEKSNSLNGTLKENKKINE